MAGLFDFSSAEDILKQRQEATRKNTLGIMDRVGRSGNQSERAAGAVGGLLAMMAGQAFSGPSDASKVADARASGEALSAAQAAGVGSEGSSYSPEVARQFAEQDKSSLGLLDPELRREVVKKRLLGGADLSTSAGTSEFAEKARASGIASIKELETLQTKAAGQKTQENQVAKVSFMQEAAGDINQKIDRQKDPIGHLSLWADTLRGNSLTQTEANSAEGKLMTALIAKDAKAGGGRKIPKANTLSAVESHMVNTGLAEQLPDDSVTAAKYWMSEKVEDYMRGGKTTGEAMVQASIDIKSHMGKTKEGWFGLIGGNPTLDIPGAVNPDEEVADVATEETTRTSPNPMGAGRFTVKRKGAE